MYTPCTVAAHLSESWKTWEIQKMGIRLGNIQKVPYISECRERERESSCYSYSSVCWNVVLVVLNFAHAFMRRSFKCCSLLLNINLSNLCNFTVKLHWWHLILVTRIVFFSWPYVIFAGANCKTVNNFKCHIFKVRTVAGNLWPVSIMMLRVGVTRRKPSMLMILMNSVNSMFQKYFPRPLDTGEA